MTKAEIKDHSKIDDDVPPGYYETKIVATLANGHHVFEIVKGEHAGKHFTGPPNIPKAMRQKSTIN